MFWITPLVTWILHLSCVGIHAQENDVHTMVYGDLNFKGKSPNVLPPGSCIWYRLYRKRDVEEVEKQKYVISHEVRYVGNMKVESGRQYDIPLMIADYEKSGKYYIQADIFVGRCPHINFIKEIWNDRKNPGDYSTRYEQKVIFNGDRAKGVKVNLPLSYFCWNWNCTTNPVDPPTYCYDKVNEKVVAIGGRYKPKDNPCQQCICSYGNLTCEQIKCNKPKDSCSLFEKEDTCCPCDAGGIVKAVKWNVHLLFKGSPNPGRLPLGSCLTFKVENRFNRIVHAEVLYVGLKELEPKYELLFDRSTHTTNPSYHLIVLLNYGWCPNIDMLYKNEPTLSDGDYENDKDLPYPTVMIPSKVEYTSNVRMKKKCIGSSCDVRTHCIDNKGKKRSQGSRWMRDPCTSCFCKRGGDIRCSKQECNLKCNPQVAVKEPGKCCPTCPVVDPCYDWITNRTYKNGESWQRDSCSKCHCMGGWKACASVGCQLPRCGPNNYHVEVDGICCPVCNNHNICEDNGAKYVEGRYWQREDCTVCRCTADGRKCFKPMRELNLCRWPVKMTSKCPRFCLPPYRTNEP